MGGGDVPGSTASSAVSGSGNSRTAVTPFYRCESGVEEPLQDPGFLGVLRASAVISWFSSGRYRHHAESRGMLFGKHEEVLA